MLTLDLLTADEILLLHDARLVARLEAIKNVQLRGYRERTGLMSLQSAKTVVDDFVTKHQTADGEWDLEVQNFLRASDPHEQEMQRARIIEQSRKLGITATVQDTTTVVSNEDFAKLLALASGPHAPSSY